MTLGEDEEDAPRRTYRYYYDIHSTHEDILGKTAYQSELMFYLTEVLQQLFRKESWFVSNNLSIFTRPDYLEYPLAPIVALFKMVIPEEAELNGWYMIDLDRPAPAVAFDISSEITYLYDLRVKPELYARMRAGEYFAYDPYNDIRLWDGPRLQGWKTASGEAVPIIPDEKGRLWSDELQSWLKADIDMLRLYDQEGNLRLTKAEAEHQAKEKAWAKLRELGIDPETL